MTEREGKGEGNIGGLSIKTKHLYKTNRVLVFPTKRKLHFSGYSGQICGVGNEHIYYKKNIQNRKKKD